MLQRTPAALAAFQNVTHRKRGDIPGCVLASDSFKAFDAEAYERRIAAFHQEVTDYVAHMNAVRAGLVAQNEAEG